MELAGRSAIVTGPAKGMGAAITLALAREGADLVLAGRDLAAIEPVAGAVAGLGRRARIVRCDVTSPAEVTAMAAEAREFGGGQIDILVNVAGGSGPLETPSWDTTPEAFDQIVELNMKGCFLTMRAVLPAMMAQRSGKIVNIGGTFGLRGRALRMAYSASKWGLRGITKSVALEAGPYNINVNTVCPGMVDGPRFERVCREHATRLGITLAEARRRHAEDYALRRISTGEDVANAVLFLVSERARQITGQDIAVDGGWVI
ncbi:MAG TPA: SDR family oxidoreductase [Stellaceae bacterium]|nr:SDR family oxidoreductase [Stellaceae bacterium]